MSPLHKYVQGVRVGSMVGFRTKTVVGAGIIALAVEMIVDPPAYVSWPLLAIGVFLLVWGVAPTQVMRAVTALPAGQHLMNWLSKFDRWFEETALLTESSDPQAAQRLRELADAGHDLQQAKPVWTGNDRPAYEIELRAWEDKIREWIQGVANFVRNNISESEAYMFESIRGPRGSDFESEFYAKCNKLRLIIGRYLTRSESKQK